MSCRNISWFICTFVAVVIATGYSGQDSNTGSHSEVAVHHLRTDNLESSTADPLQKPNGAVDLGALLDAGYAAVVTLVAGDTRLVAHRAVLSARSPVFQRILQDAATVEVAITDVEGLVLRQLLAYLYTLQAPQLPGMAPQLLVAADQYSLPALKADCEQQVAKQLSVANAAATAVLAIRHSCDSLTKVTIGYIRAHIFHVIATKGWAEAMNSQPQVMVNVTRLLSESPAETSSSAPAERGSSPYHATHPHSDYSGHQTPTTAAPTTVAQTITQIDDVYISSLRSLSPKEKGRRLIGAATEGAMGELEALLAAGADVWARDGQRMTALHYAARDGHVEVARRLLAAGAGVDAIDGQRMTALHYAAREGHLEVARLLLAAGAEVDARDKLQWTPLHYAAWHGRPAVARLLLDNNAYHSARSESESAPLNYAARNGHTEIVAMLLEAGADRNPRDQWGDTALDDARKSHHWKIVELLQGQRPDSGTSRE